jgi:flagellar biosynthesis protein FlhF
LGVLRATLGGEALIVGTRAVEKDEGGGVEILAFPELGTKGEHREPTLQTPLEVWASSTDSDRAFFEDPNDAARTTGGNEERARNRWLLPWLAPRLREKSQIIDVLTAQGLDSKIVTQVAGALRAAAPKGEESIYRELSSLIPSGGHIPDEADRVALVGPAGVGKSSSIIKLTIHEKQRLQRRVGWLSFDQRHITMGDPLALYATILGVRYETAASVKEARRAWQRLADCDLVLIDTPGVAPRNRAGLKDLQTLLEKPGDLRKILLIPGSTNMSEMTDWVLNYQQLGVSSLFFTKLDECRYFGPLINAAIRFRCPVSYVTLGQNLTGDIEIAKGEVLASLLLASIHYSGHVL